MWMGPLLRWQADRRDRAAEVTPSVDDVNDFVTNYARYDFVRPGPCMKWLVLTCGGVVWC